MHLLRHLRGRQQLGCEVWLCSPAGSSGARMHMHGWRQARHAGKRAGKAGMAGQCKTVQARSKLLRRLPGGSGRCASAALAARGSAAGTPRCLPPDKENGIIIDLG